jgi:CBS domain containing-hemolysin-like protein
MEKRKMTENAGSGLPRENGAEIRHSNIFHRFVAWARQRLRWARNGDASIRDALEELIEEHADVDTPINADESLLIENVFKLRDINAADVMVARAEIVAVEAGASLDDLIRVMTDAAHSRVPVYRETLDDILGMVHIKDILAYTGNRDGFDMSSVIRKVLFVSPTMRVLDLLLQMRLARVHLALVVDEFGGADGLVTIEDLVEEIVGDIQDEHDVDDVAMITRPDGSMIADARTDLETFEKQVGTVLTDDEREEDIETLGGLVFTLVDRVPSRGEVIRHSSGIVFEVIEADPRRIKRLRLRNLPGDSGKA